MPVPRCVNCPYFGPLLESELVPSYDAWLVTVSVVVAVLASYAALDLSARISAADHGWNRRSSSPSWRRGSRSFWRTVDRCRRQSWRGRHVHGRGDRRHALHGDGGRPLHTHARRGDRWRARDAGTVHCHPVRRLPDPRPRVPQRSGERERTAAPGAAAAAHRGDAASRGSRPFRKQAIGSSQPSCGSSYARWTRNSR